MRRCSGKANKLRYIYTIRGTLRDIAIKEREINNIKIKIIPFIIYFLVSYLPKSKKEDSQPKIVTSSSSTTNASIDKRINVK